MCKGGFVMLVAINDEGQSLILTKSLTEATLKQLRETNLYCPQCKEKLILKAGTIKIPHFAHTAYSNCDTSFAEGESYPHLLGKQQLFEHFHEKKYDVQLEKYLHELQQRPDLLIQTKHIYAIEFQCSRIPIDLIEKRTNGYNQLGIIPVWLPKTPTVSIHQGKIFKSSFDMFYQQFMNGHTVTTYDPFKKQFVYFCNCVYLHGNLFLSEVRVLPLASQVFPFYRPKPLCEKQFQMMFNQYSGYRKKYLHGRLFYSRKGVNDLFLRAIYELRLQRGDLPLHIGVPVCHAKAIPLFSAEWQLLLFYFMRCHGLSINSMNESAKHYFLSWANLPTTPQAFLALDEYIKILRRLSISDLSGVCSKEQLIQVLYSEIVAI